MPPKKNATKISNKAMPIIKTRGRQKKENTVLITPSVPTVPLKKNTVIEAGTVNSIEDPNVKAQVVQVQKVARTYKKHSKLTKDQSITLSNEVALAQLAKKSKEIDKSVLSLNKKTSILKNSKKRPTKKGVTDLNKETEMNIKTQKKKIKTLENSAMNESCTITSEDPNLEEVNMSPAKTKTVRGSKLKRKINNEEILSLTNEATDKITTLEPLPPVQKPKKITKRNPTLKHKSSVTLRPKSKRIVNNAHITKFSSVAPNEESLLLSSNDQEKTLKNVMKEKSDVIDFCRSPMTSLSELSWAKNISSGTTTCVTVSSQDYGNFVKIPFVKLYNINPIDQKTTKNSRKTNTNKLFPKHGPVIDNDSQESDDDSLTSTSLSSIKLSSVSSKSSNSKNNKNYSDKAIDKNTNINKVLDKLSSNLKKIDLEVVSWIGYANEYISNVDYLKTKLLKDDILSEERQTLVQCSKIQLLLSKYQENYSHSQVNDKITPAVHVNYSPSNLSHKQFSDLSNKSIDDHPSDCSSPLKNVVTKAIDKLNQSADQFNQCDDLINPRNDMFKQPNCQFNGSNEKNIKDTGQTTGSIEHAKNVEQNVVTIKPTDKEPFRQFDNIRYSCNKFSEDDDEDALSLFAESITGIESNRQNSSVQCAFEPKGMEEYVPQYVSSDPFKLPVSTVYQPSKIKRIGQDIIGNKTVPNICEKQNADSTSINGDFEIDHNSQENILKYEDKVNNDAETTKTESTKNSVSNPARLMANVFTPILGVKSVVFKGVCFFNMISNCKKLVCHFPHVSLEVKEVQERLQKLQEEHFIQEYMLIRMWPKLRRQYGICYVEECIKRGAVRILVEMSIDFITKANSNCSDDSVLQLTVAEYTLLYLNQINLNVCADLFNYIVYPEKNILLCDFFMTTIAETPNFSRFKMVFIKLTHFMCDTRRTFNLEVASHFLERISILPFDSSLAWALIEIIKRTDVLIFSNSMMKNFEMQLLKSNPTLHEELMAVIKPANTPDLGTKRLSLRVDHDVDRSNSTNHAEQNIRYSPDTTNLDNLNKPVVEPKFTRTINFNKVHLHINTPSTSTANSSDNYGERAREPKPNFKNWKGASILNRARNLARPDARDMLPPHRPPLRPPFKRRLDQSSPYGGSTAKYERNGPRFF